MKIKGIHIFTGLVVLAVAAAVVAGFMTVGSPSNERARRLDQQRVSDLQQVSSAVDSYWNLYKRLPENLEAMQQERNVYLGNITDPQTGAVYGYRATATTTYELCASFEMESEADMPKPVYVQPGQRFWDHLTGQKCYLLDVFIPPGTPGFKY